MASAVRKPTADSPTTASAATAGTTSRRAASRCPACRSPRLLRHQSLFALSIAHVDCDAFYATIEKRDDPSLADKPVIVGGRQRGVVLTCCYVARTFGIRSAMPIFEARRLCPHAAYVPPNMEKYAAVARQVRALMNDLTPLVEPVSIDEAFMDLSGTERLHGVPPAKTLAMFADRVERELGITVSIGLSGNKFLAKIASDLDKPRGFAVLAPRRSGGLPGEAPGHADFRRRQGGADALQQGRHIDRRRPAAHRRERADAPLRRRRRAALQSRAWPRPAAGACGPRGQEHLGRDHVRHRHFGVPSAGAAAVAADRNACPRA